MSNEHEVGLDRDNLKKKVERKEGEPTAAFKLNIDYLLQDSQSIMRANYPFLFT